MSIHFHLPVRALLAACLSLACLVARADAQADAPAITPAPIRFILSFDDGPSGSNWHNPSVAILEALAHNKIQPGIKAIFFAQTRSTDAGGSAIGRSLLQREHEEGHLLAFHTATPGHANHRYLSEQELELSLQHGVADLSAVTGSAPTLVRPPFWSYDARTVARYQAHGMQMLLTDLSANDGKIWGVNFSLSKRRTLLGQLTQLRERWRAGMVPAVDGNTPVVVTFHDINRYTASVLETYMEILLDVARELDMPTSAKPFYDDRQALERAALACTVRDGASKPPLPGPWQWIWR